MLCNKRMFFESIKRRISSANIESFGKCFIPSARGLFCSAQSFLKRVKSLFFFCKCHVVPKQSRVFCFFPPASLSFFGSGRTDKNTNSESDIIYIINAHKNGGYKRTNVSERERERGDEQRFFFCRSFFFLFFLCFCFFLKRRG